VASTKTKPVEAEEGTPIKLKAEKGSNPPVTPRMQKEAKFFTLALLSVAVVAAAATLSVSWRNIPITLI
jgi:hypothetical protein